MILKNGWLSVRAAGGVFCLLFAVIVPGCAANIKETGCHKETQPRIMETRMLEADVTGSVGREQQMKCSGSLWENGGPLTDLFVNPKARRVGDIVTISIVESSSASNKASTDTSRKSSVSGSIESLFNLENRFSDSSGFNPFSSVKGGLESTFSGSGATDRSGALTAYITARVTEILPNGNLRIAGSREVAVNNERQFITLSGFVRPRDISSDNVILSTFISDAKIAYSGSGIVSDRQRTGWMARAFDTIWPF